MTDAVLDRPRPTGKILTTLGGRLFGLGVSGAIDNARKALDARREEEIEVERLEVRLVHAQDNFKASA
jgi:hypothetical protein